MTKGAVGLVAFALVAAAGCVRLGMWQLDRLSTRRALNTVIAERLRTAPVDVAALPSDTVQSHYRRAQVSGTLDFDHDIVLGPRSRQGSPGVYIVTPVRVAGNDTAVLVNRGWVYSPDALTLDPAQFRETTTVFTGYVEEMATGGLVEIAGHPRALRRLEGEAVRKLVPYPVRPFYLVAAGDTASTNGGRPVMRLGDPPLADGPHQGYAFQWFAFATIAMVGAGIVVRQSRLAARTMP